MHSLRATTTMALLLLPLPCRPQWLAWRQLIHTIQIFTCGVVQRHRARQQPTQGPLELVFISVVQLFLTCFSSSYPEHAGHNIILVIFCIRQSGLCLHVVLHFIVMHLGTRGHIHVIFRQRCCCCFSDTVLSERWRPGHKLLVLVYHLCMYPAAI